MTTRTLKENRPKADRPTAQCMGCGDLFYAQRSDSRYCSKACRARCRFSYRHHIWPAPSAREIPLDAAMIKFRESLYAMAHTGCVGYRLFSERLQWWFPVEGKTLRTTGHYSALPYFNLVRPFERPIVPIDDIYGLVFVEEHGNVCQGIAMTPHFIKASLQVRYLDKQLRDRVRLYMAEQGFRELGPAKPKSSPRGLLSR